MRILDLEIPYHRTVQGFLEWYLVNEFEVKNDDDENIVKLRDTNKREIRAMSEIR